MQCALSIEYSQNVKWKGRSENLCVQLLTGMNRRFARLHRPLQIRAETVEVASELHLWRSKQWKGCVDQGPK